MRSDRDKDKDQQEAELGMSPLRTSAIQLHELYSELRRAGFSRSEAMQIVCAGFSSSSNNSDES